MGSASDPQKFRLLLSAPWPQQFRLLGASEFLSVSLRTHVLADAVRRSADLLAALENRKSDMVMQVAEAPVEPWRTAILLRKMVRSAVAEMMARLDMPATDHELAKRLQQISDQLAMVQAAQRARDWSIAPDFAGAAAVTTGAPDEALRTPALGREILSTARRLLDLAAQVEDEGGDPLHLGRALLDDVGLAPVRSALWAPMLLSEAVDKAGDEATQDVEKSSAPPATLR